MIELTDSEDDEEKPSTNRTKTNHNLSRSVNENEIKSNDLNKSNVKIRTSALFSEWNLNESDFEVMHHEILKRLQESEIVESLKFDIDYIRMGGFTSLSKSEIQFDHEGLRINTTSNEKFLKLFNFHHYFHCNTAYHSRLSLTK